MSSPPKRPLSLNNRAMWAQPRSKKRLLVAVVLGLGLAGFLFAYYFAAPHGDMSSPDSPSIGQSQVVGPDPDHPQHTSSIEVDPAVDESNVEQRPVEEDTGSQSDTPLSESELERLSDVFSNSVYPLFRDDFQLNKEGRSALNVFVANMPEGLDDDDLDAISGMIESQFSGPASEDMAFIITHLYRLEQEEARIMEEGEPITTMDEQLEAHEELRELREDWFGPELAEQLFAGTDDAETHSGESTAESQPEGSSDEQPQPLTDEQAELAAIERAWEQGYEEFLAEKQLIERAGLDQAEKERQVENLMQQHFAPEEMEAVRAFGQESER